MDNGQRTDRVGIAQELRESYEAVRGGTVTIRAKTVENGTITHPRLCRLCFGSMRWLPAFLRLALVVRVFFLVLVF
jgi:hypothetical protein